MNPTREEISEAVLKYRQDKQSDAVELLYHTGFKAAYHTAYQFTYEYDQSQDLAQSSVIHGLNHIDQLGKAESYIAWIKKITERKCLDYLKSAYHQKNQTFTDSYDPINELEYDPEDEKITFQPEEQLSEKTRTDIVKEVLSQLPETQKTITMMYFYDNLTMNEIADQLNVATSTVIGRLQMAKKTIRSAITDIQRRGDIKLYNVSPIAVFMWLLGRFEATDTIPEVNVPVKPLPSEKPGISKAETAKQGHTIVQKSVYTIPEHAAVTSAGTSVVTKIIAGAIVVTGTAGAGYAVMQKYNESKQNPTPVVEQQEDTTDQQPQQQIEFPPLQQKEESVSYAGVTVDVPDGWTAETYEITTSFPPETAPVIILYKGEASTENPYMVIGMLEADGLGGTGFNVSPAPVPQGASYAYYGQDPYSLISNQVDEDYYSICAELDQVNYFQNLNITLVGHGKIDTTDADVSRIVSSIKPAESIGKLVSYEFTAVDLYYSTDKTDKVSWGAFARPDEPFYVYEITFVDGSTWYRIGNQIWCPTQPVVLYERD